MSKTAVAASALGANLDVPPTDNALKDSIDNSAPELLAIHTLVSSATASARYFRWDADLGRWVPIMEAVGLDPSVDAGVKEIRVMTARIPGPYILAKTTGSGVITYTTNAGRA